MNPPGVVKIHIMLDTEAELRQADILLDFDVLIFQRPPETLHLCIIQTPSPSVHADLKYAPSEPHGEEEGKRPASSMVMVDRGEIFSKGEMATK